MWGRLAVGVRAKYWITAALALWALLAFVAWHYESSCGVFFAGPCLEKHWDGVRHLVLLKWVKEYQTLLAGVGAIAGGTFVLISTRETIAENRRVAEERERRRAISACTRVASEFREAQMMAYDHANGVQSEVPGFPETPSLLGHIYDISPQLGAIVAAHRRLVTKNLSVGSVGFGYSPRDAFASSSAIYYLLVHVADNLERDSTFNMDRTAFVDTTYFRRDLRMLGLDEDRPALVGIRWYFKW